MKLAVMKLVKIFKNILCYRAYWKKSSDDKVGDALAMKEKYFKNVANRISYLRKSTEEVRQSAEEMQKFMKELQKFHDYKLGDVKCPKTHTYVIFTAALVVSGVIAKASLSSD